MPVKKVLYVDGRAGLEGTLARAFEALRPRMEFAVTADLEAVTAALKSRSCDLLIAGNGGIGGEAGALLEQRGQLAPDIPFIVLTGPLADGEEAELIRKGADACLPFDRIAQLPALAGAVLERHLDRARQRRVRELEIVGRVSRVIAHDFNNITGAIEGYASLNLMRLPPDDPIRPDLEGIRKAVYRATALTKQLMVFSRRQLVRRAGVSLPGFMEKLLGKMRQAAGEGVKIELKLQDGLPEIYADEPQLEQLFMNLFANSLDAMPGGGAISLGAELVRLEPREVRARNPEAEGTEFFKFSFSDTGAGMSPGVTDRLFEPFFTTKPKGKGLGMGLPSVYGIVLQHTGWVEARSSEGKGTEFSVFLPAGPGKPEPAEAARGI